MEALGLRNKVQVKFLNKLNLKRNRLKTTGKINQKMWKGQKIKKSPKSR